VDLMGPQVRDSRRIYLTAFTQTPPKTPVSHPNVHDARTRFTSVLTEAVNALPIVTSGRFNANFAASPGLHIWVIPALYLVSPKTGRTYKRGRKVPITKLKALVMKEVQSVLSSEAQHPKRNITMELNMDQLSVFVNQKQAMDNEQVGALALCL